MRVANIICETQVAFIIYNSKVINASCNNQAVDVTRDSIKKQILGQFLLSLSPLKKSQFIQFKQPIFYHQNTIHISNT